MGTTYQPYPLDGDTSWGDWARNSVGGIDDRLLGLEAGGGGGGSSLSAGILHLDSYTGTPDQKLSTFMAAAAAETHPSSLTWDNLRYDFSVGSRVPYDGLRLVGPPGIGNAERLGQTKMASRWHLSMTGPMFKLSGSTATFDSHFENLALTGGSQAVFLGMGAGATAVWRNLVVRNLTAVNLRSVIGEYASKLLITSPTFDGWWEINATYDTAVHIGGSGEGILWPAGGLFDGGGDAYNIAGSSTGHPTIWLDGLEMANIGPVFITAEDGWEGIRVNGPTYNSTTGNQGGPIRFYGVTVEGRNAGQPCWGSLIRCIGGISQFYGLNMAHALSAPSSMGHSPADVGGLDLQSGAYVKVDGFMWDRYTGQAETDPAIKVRSGTKLRVQDALSGAKGGTWSGLPRIQVDSTGTCQTSDGTWTLI
jgi:hypothetical protein